MQGFLVLQNMKTFLIVCLNRAVLSTAIVGLHYRNRTPVPSLLQNR